MNNLVRLDKADMANRALSRLADFQIQGWSAAVAAEQAMREYMLARWPADLMVGDVITVNFSDGEQKVMFDGIRVAPPRRWLWGEYQAEAFIALRKFTKKGKPRKDVKRFSGSWIFDHYRHVDPKKAVRRGK